MAQKVLIVGGLGFVGYHIVQELKIRGYEPVIGSRNNKHDDTAEAPIIEVDLKKMSDQELLQVLAPFDYVIFAGGADDRTIPKEDAATFFYAENVLPCVRLAELAKQLPLQKIIILGSYFSHFNRTRPEWKMAERHPYVRSRLLQQEETIEAAGNETAVIILELPYIFGSSPGKIPLWKPLVKYIKNSRLVFYTSGGTNIVSVEKVAKATVGAIEHAKHSERWIVGGENVSWKELISKISNALGKKRIVVTVPTFIVKVFALLTYGYFRLINKQVGLNLYHFITTQTSCTFLDTSDSMRHLGYENADMQEAINDTVKASL